ncbi:MAG: bacteriochlorophyll 4-vinyl reductase [Paracoccaceae bacterium]
MAVTNKWRTLRDAQQTEALIGPNAILQYLPILDDVFGEKARDALLRKARVHKIPDGTIMIPEGEAIRLQKEIRLRAPLLAPDLARQAGIATADYILAHRIPKLVQNILKLLPRHIAARLLSRAIAAHAWTFVGSGTFSARSPWLFEIAHNPMVHGERSDHPLCFWQAAVFERLYQELIDKRIIVEEARCCAQSHCNTCVFECLR